MDGTVNEASGAGAGALAGLVSQALGQARTSARLLTFFYDDKGPFCAMYFTGAGKWLFVNEHSACYHSFFHASLLQGHAGVLASKHAHLPVSHWGKPVGERHVSGEADNTRIWGQSRKPVPVQ